MCERRSEGKVAHVSSVGGSVHTARVHWWRTVECRWTRVLTVVTMVTMMLVMRLLVVTGKQERRVSRWAACVHRTSREDGWLNTRCHQRGWLTVTSVAQLSDIRRHPVVVSCVNNGVFQGQQSVSYRTVRYSTVSPSKLTTTAPHSND